MVTVGKCVSLTPDEAYFVETYNLSCTSLLKSKIMELKNFMKAELENKIQKMTRTLQDLSQSLIFAQEFIAKNNLKSAYEQEVKNVND